MKKTMAALLILSLFLTDCVVIAESFSIGQNVPFGTVIESTDLYRTVSTKTSIGKAAPGLICQIIATERLGGEQWYKVRCFAGDNELTGYIIGRYMQQMTLADLITAMSDPSTAAYMQSFVGFTMLGDFSADTEAGSRYTEALVTPEPTATPSPTIEADLTTYVLNTSTRRFHYPDCGGVKTMSEKNRSVFKGTREQLIGLGFKPCGECKP